MKNVIGRTLPRLPTVLVIVSSAVILLSIAMMLVGAIRSGVTWDEEVHVNFLRSFFQNGWNVDASGVVNGLPDPTKIWGIYVYGPVAGLMTHALAVLLGTESWGVPLSSPEAYAIRHIATAMFGIAGLGSVALALRLIVGSWRWGVLAAAILSSIPLWTGQSMFNVKDLPVASGYTLATTGIIALMTVDSGFWSRRQLLGWALLTGGAVIAAGTRMAAGVPIAMTVVAVAVFQLVLSTSDGFSVHRRRWRIAGRTLIQGTACLVASYLILLVIYPKAFIDPVRLAYESLLVSARFPFDESVLTNGVWLDQPVTWSYLPQWFAAQLPLLVTLGALFFVTWWAVTIARAFRSRGLTDDRRIIALSFPVILQLLLLPLGAIVFSSSIYNGTRQFLFVLPAVATLSALAIAIVARKTVTDASRIRSAFLWFTVGAGIVVPCFAQVQLFPYNYAYFNFPTSLAGIDNRWPTDYWRSSGREIVRTLPSSGRVSCSYEQYRKDALYDCFVEPPFSTFRAERGTEAASDSIDDSQFWYIRENQGDTVLPLGCSPYKTLTRQLYFTEITIAQIATCDLEAEQFGFDSPAE